VDSVLDQLADELRGGAVPSGCSMGVDLECNRRVGVANPITENFGVDAGVKAPPTAARITTGPCARRCDRNHDAARGPGGPCSVATRSHGQHLRQMRCHSRLGS
jgi:hypothetical protein